MATSSAARTSVASNQVRAPAKLPSMVALSVWPGHVVGSQSMRWTIEVRLEMSGRPLRPKVCRRFRFQARYRPAPVRPATAAATSRASRAGTRSNPQHANKHEGADQQVGGHRKKQPRDEDVARTNGSDDQLQQVPADK